MRQLGKYWPHLAETTEMEVQWAQNVSVSCIQYVGYVGPCLQFVGPPSYFIMFLLKNAKLYKCYITYHLLPVSCDISILTTTIRISDIGDGCVSIFEKQKGLGPQLFCLYFIIHIHIYIYHSDVYIYTIQYI